MSDLLPNDESGDYTGFKRIDDIINPIFIPMADN
jgi:hypothetical protein